MVSHIEEFDYITTSTEMEALILENNLIKKYMQIQCIASG